MYQYKAIKDGVLSNPYKRVREGDVVTLSKPVVKSTWLVPVEDYKPKPEQVTVPHMQKVPPKEPQTVSVPPAPSSVNYQRGMEDIKAMEAKQDGLTQVQPGKFVGEAQPVQPAPQPEATEQPKTQEGTGNQDVIG